MRFFLTNRHCAGKFAAVFSVMRCSSIFAVWRIYAASRTPFIVNFQRSWGMMFIGFCERYVKSVLRRVGVLDAFNNAGNEICIMNFK